MQNSNLNQDEQQFAYTFALPKTLTPEQAGRAALDLENMFEKLPNKTESDTKWFLTLWNELRVRSQEG